MADMADEGAFDLEPLRDPTHFIRLLSFELAGDGPDINVVLSTWPRGAAPGFSAISYTWGDERSMQTITVNGKRLTVRENCHYALRQARSYKPKSFIWIDSICINQHDLREKGLQVGKMVELYRAAEQVLVCIGPSAEGSDTIMKLGCHLRQSDDEILWSLPVGSRGPAHPEARRFGSRLSNARLRWILSQSDEYVVHVNQAMKHFSERPYWKRVWIVQEIAAAKDSVVLCGSQSMPWEGLVRARDTLTGISDMGAASHGLIKLDASPIRNLQMAATRQIRSLQSFISHFRDSKCADARDRLFAFGALIEWHPTSPIAVDYTKSAFQLLVDLAERELVSEDLLHALEVYSSHPEMKAAVRRLQQAGLDVSPPPSERNAAIRYRLGGTNRIGQLQSRGFGELSIRTEGTYLELSASDEAVSFGSLLENIRKIPNPHQLDWAVRMPQQIKNQQGALVGWTCHEAQPGDVLIPCSQAIVIFATTTPYMLVLRQNEGETFDIIGQALLLADCTLPWLGRGYVAPGTQRPNIDGYSVVELHISAEDKIVLTGQDLARGRTHDRTARVERLFTSVTAAPQRAAKVTFHVHAIRDDERGRVAGSPAVVEDGTVIVRYG